MIFFILIIDCLKVVFNVKNLAFFVFIFLFSINSIYSAPEQNCLTINPLAESNSVIQIYNDYECTSGFDFTGINNLTVLCNGYFLKSTNNQDFTVSNSNINFEECDLRISGLGSFVENSNTNLDLKNSVYNIINLSTTSGNYSIFEKVTIDVEDELNEDVPDFLINVSSNSVFPYEDLISNSSVNYLEVVNYINGSKKDYNNFTVNVSSDLFGSSNFSINNFSLNNYIQLVLTDLNSPTYTSVIDLIDNESMYFNVFFDEPVNGTLEILHDNGTQIVSNEHSSFYTNMSINTNGLNPQTPYKLNIYVYDRFGNGPLGETINYDTYITLNMTTGVDDVVVYQGDPQNTSSFNFSSSLYNILAEFLEPVNLSNNLNISDEIIISNNSIFINSSSRFNKIVRLFFDNLPYQSTPVILKDGIVCGAQCNLESYSSGNLVFNVTGFSNYSTISNSRLNVTNTTPYVGKQIFMFANYSRYNDSVPIINSSCYLNIDSKTKNMTFNATSGYHEINLSYDNFGTHFYEVECYSSNYDDKNFTSILNLTNQPIDNFSIFLDFKEKTGYTYLTVLKDLNITISSSGTNNTDNNYDAYYEFLVSRDVVYPQVNWNTTKNLTNWINIGKNEFFRLYNTGENFTYFELGNSSIGNFSNFIFIDERDLNNTGTSLYVTVRACVPGGFCKYFGNSSNFMIYEDTSAPELLGNISVERYYNLNNYLNFTFGVRDLESKVEDVFFAVPLNSSTEATNISTTFLEGDYYTYSSFGFDFDEGKWRKILLDVSNKIGLTKQYVSSEFLIDTIAPINSTFNISLTENEYYNDTLILMNFSAGQDYDINYWLMGKEASGLDYMKIAVRNASLQNDNCVAWSNYLEINESFTESNSSYLYNVTDGYCYKFSYRVYDKAGNFNEVEFNETVKVDLTKPIINNLVGEGVPIIDFLTYSVPPNNIDNINKFYSDLDDDEVIFKVKFNITDDQSSIDYYNIEIIDASISSVVANVTNYTSEIFVVYYNSSYIFDNRNYEVRVEAVNKAGLKSNKVKSNGATVFVLKVPEIVMNESYEINSNKLFDFTDDGFTNVNFYEKNGFNVSCKTYDSDISYQNDSGTLCSSNGYQVQCPFNTTIFGSNHYYISCMSNESIKEVLTYNDPSNNFDLEVFVEENVAPFINLTQITFSANETLNYVLPLVDNNSENLWFSNYSIDIDNLSITIMSTNQNIENIDINFLSGYAENDLEIIGFNYNFYFNDSLNHSQIISLNEENLNSSLLISSSSLSENVVAGSYDFSNSTEELIGGVSNDMRILNVSSIYNISYNNVSKTLEWDLNDFSNRVEVFNVSINVSDDFNSAISTFEINVTASNIPPKVNQSYYLLNNNQTIYNNKNISINVSKFFFEENSIYGLNDSLSYSVSSLNKVIVLDFNVTTGIMQIRGDDFYTGPSSIVIKAINNWGEENSTTLDFDVDFYMGPAPPIFLNSPINGGSLLSSMKNLSINISSNESLQYISLNANGVIYILCQNCSSYVGSYNVLSLEEGVNNNLLQFYVKDYDNLTNMTSLTYGFRFDHDEDAIPDSVGDNDDDGDGINDSQDSIVGLENHTYSNLNDGKFYVNGSSNLSINYTNTNVNVSFSDLNYTYLNFKYNFSNNSLDLRESFILFDEFERYILVNGLNLSEGEKSVFIPESNDSIYSTLCIKDSEVSSISQMNSGCDDVDEVVIQCPSSNGNFSCESSIQNNKSFWQVSGLKHSAVKLICTENWQVGSWSSCSGGTQSRLVTDLNSCGTEFFKPITTQSCNVFNGGGSGGGGGGGSSRSSSDIDLGVLDKEESIIKDLEKGDTLIFIIDGKSYELDITEVNPLYVSINNSDGINFNLFTFKRIDIDGDGEADLYFELKYSNEDEAEIYIKRLGDEVEKIISSDFEETPVIEEVPIFIGNVGNELNKLIEFDKLYSFNIDGKLYEGKFELIDSLVNFIATKNEDLIFIGGEVILDIDKDGENDFKLKVSNVGESYYFSGEEIKVEEVIEEIEDQRDSFNQSIVVEENSVENSSWSFYLLLLLILLVLMFVFYIAYNKRISIEKFPIQNVIEKNEFKKEKINSGVKKLIPKKEGPMELISLDELGLDKDLNKIIDIERASHVNKFNVDLTGKYDDVLTQFEIYSEELKKIVLKERLFIDKFKGEVAKLITKGNSRVRIYFYLKEQGFSDFFMRNILSFEDLIENFKKFVKVNDLSKFSEEELKRKLFSQKWFKQVYMYDGDGKEIMRDILFLLAGTKVYGFSKEKFRNIFEEEFDRAVRNTNSSYLDFSNIDVDKSKLDSVLEFIVELRLLKSEVEKYVEYIKSSNDFNDLEIEKLVKIGKRLFDDIIYHLK